MKDFYNEEIINNATEKQIKAIDESKHNKKVLIGSGTGRTTLLNNLNQREDLNYDYYKIDIDALTMFNDTDSIHDIVSSYYELVFARKLIDQAYDKCIKLSNQTTRYNTQISLLLKDFDNYYNNYFGAKDYFNDSLKIKDYKYTKKILENIKESNDKSLALIINRFDHINGSDKYTQEYLSNYFKLFDKTIITSDDNTLEINKVNRRIDYNLKVVEQIVRLNIYQYLRNNVEPGKKEKYLMKLNEIISPLNIARIYTKLNGNLKDIISVYKYFIIYNYNNSEDLDHIMSDIIINNENKNKYAPKVKLYIK